MIRDPWARTFLNVDRAFALFTACVFTYFWFLRFPPPETTTARQWRVFAIAVVGARRVDHVAAAVHVSARGLARGCVLLHVRPGVTSKLDYRTFALLQIDFL